MTALTQAGRAVTAARIEVAPEARAVVFPREADLSRFVGILDAPVKPANGGGFVVHVGGGPFNTVHLGKSPMLDAFQGGEIVQVTGKPFANQSQRQSMGREPNYHPTDVSLWSGTASGDGAIMNGVQVENGRVVSSWE